MPRPAKPLNDREPPPETHVHLILYGNEDGNEFYLEIPISVVSNLVVKPHKYLRYLGWCTLGVEGRLLDEESEGVDLEAGELVKGGTYIYDPAGPAFQYVVDLEVIKLRTKYSCSSARNSTFLIALEERDLRCAFIGLPAPLVGMHIIPHTRGDEWIDLIIKNRPGEDGDSEQLETIDDIRNGILVSSHIHILHDSRKIVILKTPNPMLEPKDVKPRSDDRDLSADVEYPSDGTRFTLQWIVLNPDPKKQQTSYRRIAANNLDATFFRDTGLPKPSGVLLHYNYGAAVVKHWGRNTTLLTDRAAIPRPQTVVEPESRRPTTRSKYGGVIEKSERARAAGGSQSLGRNGGRGGAADSEGWDEDDVMMFLWGNNPHAVERWNKERKDKEDKINQWRSGISVEQH